MKRLAVASLLLSAVAAWLILAQPPAAGENKVQCNGHTFTLPEGFEIELVAGPPLVDRPIVADFGSFEINAMWVILGISLVALAFAYYLVREVLAAPEGTDKMREIATLKLMGARDRTIVGLILQQAMALGVVRLAGGASLLFSVKDFFPRRVVLGPEQVAVFGLLVVAICLVASLLGVRLALRVEPAQALGG